MVNAYKGKKKTWNQPNWIVFSQANNMNKKRLHQWKRGTRKDCHFIICNMNKYNCLLPRPDYSTYIRIYIHS